MISTENSTLLDTQSTSAQNFTQPTYRRHLINKCPIQYYITKELYRFIDDLDDTEYSYRLESCRTMPFFMVNKNTLKVRIASQSCNLRFCPLCQKSKRSNIAANVKKWMKSEKHPKMITLTMKTTDEDLKIQLDRLYKCFKQLRRLKLFKEKTTGGIWFFQVTQTTNPKAFHPHLHIITAGDYIPHRQLSREWQRITGESFIVDLRAVKNIKKSADYVSRYATMPANLLYMEQMAQACLFYAIKGRRLCGTFGSAYKQKLTKKPEIDKETWKKIKPFHEIMKMQDGDETAKAMVQAWISGKPLKEMPNFPSSLKFSNIIDTDKNKPEPEPYLEFDIF